MNEQKFYTLILLAFVTTFFSCGKNQELIPMKSYSESHDLAVDFDGKSISIARFDGGYDYYFNKEMAKYKDDFNFCNRDYAKRFPTYELKSEYNGYLTTLHLRQIYKRYDYLVYEFAPNKSLGETYYYVYSIPKKKFVFMFDGETF